MKSILQRYRLPIPVWVLGIGVCLLVTSGVFRLVNGLLPTVNATGTEHNGLVTYAWPKQCTAEIYKVVNGAEVPAAPAVTYYVNRSDLCMEILPEPGDLCRVFFNREHTRSWLVYVDRREYKEISLSPAQIEKVQEDAGTAASYARNELKFIGTESVDGQLCDKFQTEKENGEGPAVLWVNQKLGQIVKTEMEVNGVAVGEKIVRFGPPDPSVFEIPAGFQQVDR